MISLRILTMVDVDYKSSELLIKSRIYTAIVALADFRNCHSSFDYRTNYYRYPLLPKNLDIKN